MEDVRKEHYKMYLDEDRTHDPKEYFKFVVNLTRERFGNISGFRVMDIGCASGDFLYYLNQCFPDVRLHGMDMLESLVSTARLKAPGAHFSIGDINSLTFTQHETYDLVYMLGGLHSIFDSCDQWTKNLSYLLTEDGVAFVFGIFNPFPYDVIVKVKKSGSEGEAEAGWNTISRETIATAFNKHGCRVEFVPWNIPIEIPFNKNDPLRSWTSLQPDGKTLVTNASRVIHDFYCAIISKT